MFSKKRRPSLVSRLFKSRTNVRRQQRVLRFEHLEGRTVLAASLSTLHMFTDTDSGDSTANLTLVGSTLYGTTQGTGISSGTVFSMKQDGSNFQVLHTFTGPDGTNPSGSLTLVGSTLYGTAQFGGANGCGDLFSISTTGSNFKDLYDFAFTDGASPVAGLTLVGSKLFGTAPQGGANFDGEVFSISTNGTGFKIVHNFADTDGATPTGGLTLSGSTLYGTTSSGGTDEDGVVYSLNSSGSGFSVLHNFVGTDAAQPDASLTLVGTTLYGTTSEGGSAFTGTNLLDSAGTVFSLKTNGTGFQVLHNFSSAGPDGIDPEGNVTFVGPVLFGATEGDSGLNGGGTLFSMNANGSNYQTVYSFSGPDGIGPLGLITVGSNVVGTTTFGGDNIDGTVYSYATGITLTVTPASLPNWTSGKSGFSQTIRATGATGAESFVVTSGALPAGLTLNKTTGVLSGTPKTVSTAITYNFTITATDSLGITGAMPYTVIVNPPLAISAASFPNGTVGVTSYNQKIVVTGGTGAETFKVTSGSLPAGLSLNTTTGVISGKPTTANKFSFTVTATDAVGATAAKSYSVTIGLPVVESTAALASWTVNKTGYSQTITATGGTKSYSFKLTAGSLPTGLNLATSGKLTGTPTVPGTYNFTVTATDSGGVAGSNAYTVTINPAIALLPASIANGTLNVPGYSQSISVTGGTGADTFSLTHGSLPAGLTLNKTTGIISGKPTKAGSYQFTITATDKVGATGSMAYTLVIKLTA